MPLSPQAEDILAALSRDQGLRKPLRLDDGGFIPITLGDDLTLSISFSGANNSFFLVGALDSEAKASPESLWRVFEETGELAERRTRVGLDPDSGQALLVRDVFLKGLAYPAFLQILETFVADLTAVSQQLRQARGGDGASAPAVESRPAMDGFMIFRA